MNPNTESSEIRIPLYSVDLSTGSFAVAIGVNERRGWVY